MSATSAVVEQRNQDATVWVGGLDDNVDEELLWELFVQVGPIVSVFLPRDKVSARHQGFAFVEFRGEEDAEYASKVLNMTRLYGKLIRVNKAGAASKGGSASGPAQSLDVGANLFIGNLAPEVDEKLLYDTFSAFGSVPIPPKVGRDPSTNAPKGYGFVSYDCFESSDLAIECMHGQFLAGRQIVVQYAFKKQPNEAGGSGQGANASFKGLERHGSAAERLLAASARAMRQRQQAATGSSTSSSSGPSGGISAASAAAAAALGLAVPTSNAQQAQPGVGLRPNIYFAAAPGQVVSALAQGQAGGAASGMGGSSSSSSSEANVLSANGAAAAAAARLGATAVAAGTGASALVPPPLPSSSSAAQLQPQQIVPPPLPHAGASAASASMQMMPPPLPQQHMPGQQMQMPMQMQMPTMMNMGMNMGMPTAEMITAMGISMGLTQQQVAAAMMGQQPMQQPQMPMQMPMPMMQGGAMPMQMQMPMPMAGTGGGGMMGMGMGMPPMPMGFPGAGGPAMMVGAPPAHQAQGYGAPR